MNAPRQLRSLPLGLSILSLLLAVPPSGEQQSVHGVVRRVSCELFREYTLELTGFGGRGHRDRLLFRIPRPDLTLPAEWIDLPPEECGQKLCSPGIRGKLQFTSRSEGSRGITSLSGNFVVDFEDGQKLEGAFKAKGIPDPARIICE